MQQVLNAMVLWSVYVLFALGLSLAWGSLKLLNLAHGAVFMFSGFAAHLISQQFQLPFWMVLTIAMLVGGLLSVILDLLLFHPVKVRVKDEGQAELLMLIGSIGAGSILVSIAQMFTDDSPFGIAQASALTSDLIQLGAIKISTAQILIVVLGVALSIAVGIWVRATQSGRALRAIAFDEETSQLMGINPRRLSTLTMFVAGALAGVGSVLLMSHVGALIPTSGDAFLVKAFAVIILGGIGSVAGVVVGAAVLAIGESLVLTFTTGEWVDAASFAIIMAFVLLRPQGIFAVKTADRV